MNVLFVDDNEDSIAPAMDIFKNNSVNCRNAGFEDFESKITEQKPDVVVLDMMNGNLVGNDPSGEGGKEIFSKIWEKSFCPIIIYSANPELSEASEHPFIDKVKKGVGSEDEVWKSASRFNAYFTARKVLEKIIESTLNETLRDTASAIFSDDKSKPIDDQIILHLTRRRLAAAMDHGLYPETLMQPFEQYIYPTIGDNWLQGDVIKHKNDDSFYLVLTPSCDLVKRSGNIKAQTILCAKCGSYKDKKKSLQPLFKSKKVKRCDRCKTCAEDKQESCTKEKEARHQEQIVQELISMLNSGIVGQYFLLPELGNVLPSLLADFKNFILIEKDEMGNFERIVSIDSPFREQLSWVFVSIIGRPGMPDRNFQTWANENI